MIKLDNIINITQNTGDTKYSYNLNGDVKNIPVGIMLTDLDNQDSVKNVVNSECPFAKVYHFIVNSSGANRLVSVTKRANFNIM